MNKILLVDMNYKFNLNKMIMSNKQINYKKS